MAEAPRSDTLRDGYQVVDAVWHHPFVSLVDTVQALASGDPMNPTSPDAVVVRWHELARLAPIEPWPSLLLVWRWAGGGEDGRVFAPRTPAVAETFADEVERLVLHAERFAARTVARGWLEIPDVGWEDVRRPPSTDAPAAGAGAYRTAVVTPEERIVATRTAPSSFETLLHWLASTPERPFAAHPREVIVTDQYVYRSARGRWARIPLETLRLVRGAEDGDRVYVFARHTELLLPRRDACAVRDALDARLRSRDGAPGADA